jgi:hypothetical protein
VIFALTTAFDSIRSIPCARPSHFPRSLFSGALSLSLPLSRRRSSETQPRSAGDPSLADQCPPQPRHLLSIDSPTPPRPAEGESHRSCLTSQPPPALLVEYRDLFHPIPPMRTARRKNTGSRWIWPEKTGELSAARRQLLARRPNKHLVFTLQRQEPFLSTPRSASPVRVASDRSSNLESPCRYCRGRERKKE